MAARLKKIRRLGTPLPGLTRKIADRRPYPPGAHGVRSRVRKTEYRRQLEEKQKVRFHYSVSESQLRRYIAGTTGDHAEHGATRLAPLELRLDNVVFRLGWAPTIPAARQLVVHGHVRVNGRRVDRPAAQLKTGDRLELSDRARRIPAVVAAIEAGPEVPLPSYLRREADPYTAWVCGIPRRTDIPFEVDEISIIEFYAR